jgi:phosphatidylethanolamine/phosphatidyl-N-methylethanolamine N-methyltransferase
MPLPALQLLEKKFEKQRRIFELRKGALEKKFERHIQFFEQSKGAFEKTIEHQKKKLELGFESLDNDVRFIRTWFEKPLAMGAVTPSGRALARTMAAYVDASVPGAIIELGPGTGPITEALVAQGIDPLRLVLVEFDATFCRLLRARYPTATVVQGDAYGLKRLLAGLIQEPAAAIVSGLPLFTKPLKTRLRLLFEAFGLMAPGAPFIQFTYNTVPPIPTRLDRVRAQASERVWMNIPPARVWVYRRDARRTTDDGQ